jgi:hypothetical protein
MNKESREKNVIRVIFEKIFIPAIAIAAVWLIIPRWPYILLIILVGFLILVLVPVIDFLKKKY